MILLISLTSVGALKARALGLLLKNRAIMCNNRAVIARRKCSAVFNPRCFRSRGSGSRHRSRLVPRMPATTTIEARVQENRDATLHVDSSLGPKGTFAFPAPQRNTCSFNVGYVAVVFE